MAAAAQEGGGGGDLDHLCALLRENLVEYPYEDHQCFRFRTEAEVTQFVQSLRNNTVVKGLPHLDFSWLQASSSSASTPSAPPVNENLIAFLRKSPSLKKLRFHVANPFRDVFPQDLSLAVFQAVANNPRMECLTTHATPDTVDALKETLQTMSSIQTLDLSLFQWGQGEVLAVPIQGMLSLRKLKLYAGSTNGHRALVAILEPFATKTTGYPLRELHLSLSGNSVGTVTALHRVLVSVNCSLQNLVLEGISKDISCIRQDPMATVLEGLQANDTISHLGLTKCKLSLKAGSAFRSYLTLTKILRKLVLQGIICSEASPSGHACFWMDLTNGICANGSIESLEFLNSSELFSVDRMLLPVLQRNTGLEHLKVDSRSVSPKIVLALRLHPRLRSFELVHQQGTASRKALEFSVSLVNAYQSPASSLCSLKLSGGMGNESPEALMYVLRSTTCHLKELHLDRCGLDALGVAVILRALVENDTVQTFTLREKELDEAACEALIHALPSLKIKRFKLYLPNSLFVKMPRLVASVEKSDSLVDFKFAGVVPDKPLLERIRFHCLCNQHWRILRDPDQIGMWPFSFSALIDSNVGLSVAYNILRDESFGAF